MEAAGILSEPFERRVVSPSSGCIQTTLIQEGAAARLDLSVLVTFCCTEGIIGYQGLEEAVEFIQGLYRSSRSHTVRAETYHRLKDDYIESVDEFKKAMEAEAKDINLLF